MKVAFSFCFDGTVGGKQAMPSRNLQGQPLVFSPDTVPILRRPPTPKRIAAILRSVVIASPYSQDADVRHSFPLLA